MPMKRAMDRIVSPVVALVAALALALGALGLARAPGADATAPDAVTTRGTLEGVDDQSCDFPIAVALEYSMAARDYFDRSGSLKQSIVHVHAVGTDSANGVSLRGSAHYVIRYEPGGGATVSGLTVHATLPGGGVVARDAGSFLRNPDGSVALVRGPHPALTGDTAEYCAAFGSVPGA
jgi:hypothetical protein